MGEVLDYSKQAVAEATRAWRKADESLISSAIPSAPRFPIECFGNAASYLKQAARGANVAPDYPAAMLLAAVCALRGKTYSVRVSSDWFEPLVLWSAIVGPPSSGKTPACKPIRKKLKALEQLLADNHRIDMEKELQHAELDDAPKSEIDRLRELLEKPPRYLVNDSTSEALARIESRSPNGLLIERDELAGLIEGLERYNGGGDRAFYLEGFNGGPFTLDRVKAGTISIPNHCNAVFGGIQPDRARSIITHSGDDDGFAARLLFFWPNPMPAVGVPSGADHSEMETALERICDHVPLEDQRIFSLSPEAFGHFDDWYKTDHGRRVGTLGKRGSAFGKLPGYAVRVAGILHLLDWAFGQPVGDPNRKISCDHMIGSLTLIETYFVPQIERAYHGADDHPPEALAGAILREAKRRKSPQINMRTVRREWKISGSRAQGAAKLFDEAAAVLVDTGWAIEDRKQGGSKDYLLNPQLFRGSIQ